MREDAPDTIDAAAHTALIAAIGVGARLHIACGYARLDPAVVRRMVRTDRKLAAEIFQAQCRHQVRNLLKLEKAGQVQSAIFALERRWPGRFARPRPKGRRKHRKPMPTIDLSEFASDVLEGLERKFAESRRVE